MSDYTVDYFIEKFRKIPSRKWCVDDLHTNDGRACALGHCGMGKGFGEASEADALMAMFRACGMLVSSVNNRASFEYKQKTPRARILAALQDIKAKSNKGEL